MTMSWNSIQTGSRLPRLTRIRKRFSVVESLNFIYEMLLNRYLPRVSFKSLTTCKLWVVKLWSHSISSSKTLVKEYTIFRWPKKLHWPRVCYSRDENNVASSLFEAESRERNHRKRCWLRSTNIETRISLENEAQLIEAALFISMIFSL